MPFPEAATSDSTYLKTSFWERFWCKIFYEMSLRFIRLKTCSHFPEHIPSMCCGEMSPGPFVGFKILTTGDILFNKSFDGISMILNYFSNTGRTLFKACLDTLELLWMVVGLDISTRSCLLRNTSQS